MITRSEWRLVLTTGLMNGLASLSSLPFGFYAPMAVLAVSGGSYGTSLELGRQRLLGSLLGMAVLLISLRGLQGLPMPLGMGLALGGMRVLGGALGLRVGYKVGGMIVVMGWIPHDGQLEAWVPLRLFWTVVGILASLLSLRLLWPSRAGADCQAALVELLEGLAGDLEQEAKSRPSVPRAAAAHDARQATLQRLRGLLPALAHALGTQPLRHPLYRLVETFEEAASQLLGASRTLSTLPPLPGDPAEAGPRQSEHDLLRTLADRLRLWCRALEERQGTWPRPPVSPLKPPPSWLTIEDHFRRPELNALPPRHLERFAARLSLCHQALRAIDTAEQGWAALRSPSAP